MSKARSVIMSVVVEGRSQADTARLYGVSQSWVSRLVARYRTQGDTAFEPRSRRPKNSPTKIDAATIELIIKIRRDLDGRGLDAGAHTISWHLQTHHNITIAPSTIWRHLVAAGLVIPEPKKRPKSSYIRFQAELPNQMWQTDFCHWRLAEGSDSEILTWWVTNNRCGLSRTHQPGDDPVRQQLEMTSWEGDGPAGVAVAPVRSIEVVSGIDTDEPRYFRFPLNQGERLAIGASVQFAETSGGARFDLGLVHESDEITQPLESASGWLEGYETQAAWEAPLDGQYILTVDIEPDTAHSDPAMVLAIFVFPPDDSRDASRSELPADVVAALMNGLRSVRDFVGGSG